MTDEVDDWSVHFKDLKPQSRRAEREERQGKERRTQLTDKQRERPTAIRTEQVNYRCSPAYKAKLKALTTHKGAKRSMSDVAEIALDLLAKHEGLDA